MIVIAYATPGFAGNGAAPRVAIDLDRNTTGIQDEILNFSGGSVVQGSVVVTGEETTMVADYAVEVSLARTGGGDAVNCAGTTLSNGEITSSFPAELCTAVAFRRSNLFVNPAVAVGADGVLVLFNFDAEILCDDQQSVVFDFTSTADVSLLGLTVDGSPRTFGAGTQNPIDTSTATVRCGVDGGVTPTPCGDTGYYLLDAFGGRHHVGNPMPIVGSLYYGRDVAEDMEWTLSAFLVEEKGTSQEDLAVLDTFGAVQYVHNPADTPSQTFYWPEGSDPDCGYAVDIEIPSDFSGFWVLTERGGIYRAGSALPDGQDAQLGNDAADLCDMLGIPFGGATPRDPNLPAGDGADISAVGFVVVRGDFADNPTGFVVLDSQGGHYIFDGSGNTLSDGVEGSILNADTAYPFFRGLDIARDIELPARAFRDKVQANDGTAGLVIYDGWGGVHPVPVAVTANSEVAFLRNEGLTSVGLPYLKTGFDDPSTPANEGNSVEVGIDVGSIFKDIEFCATGTEGVYVLDGFGGVFAFGSTRNMPDDPSTLFTGSPYFFPNILARDLEGDPFVP